MSRRITLSILAACTALSVTPAFADNDCFDQTTCPPAEETLAREQRALEDRTRELREQEAQAAAEALAQQRAEERRQQEVAAQEEAARKQAAETQRAMQRAAEEQAKEQATRESAAAARAAQDEAAHEQQYAKEREAEEQRATERRAQQLRAAQQQRMPNVVEPPVVVQAAPAVQPPAVVEAPKTAQAPKEIAAPVKAPVVAATRANEPAKQPAILSTSTGIVPPVVSTVPPKQIARPAERYEEPSRPQKPAKRVAETPHQHQAPAVQPAPSTYEEPREAVRVVQRAPIITGSVPVHSPVISAPVYVDRGPPAGTIVIVKGATYEDRVTPAVSGVRPDPATKFCQTDQRADGRYVYCNQGSYHPYGANGYRPMGTYKAYGSSPGYISAQPGPRIISLVTD